MNVFFMSFLMIQTCSPWISGLPETTNREAFILPVNVSDQLMKIQDYFLKMVEIQDQIRFLSGDSNCQYFLKINLALIN